MNKTLDQLLSWYQDEPLYSLIQYFSITRKELEDADSYITLRELKKFVGNVDVELWTTYELDIQNSYDDIMSHYHSDYRSDDYEAQSEANYGK